MRCLTWWLMTILLDIATGNFHRGDFVQMSRRGQFRMKRTTWHDLQGRHCPRFNIDTTVAVPIPKPKEYDQLDEYKLQLAFDHERLFSSWLTVLAKPNAPGSGFDKFQTHKLTSDVLIPFVHVKLWKRDDVLLRVHVESSRLPDVFVMNHPNIVEEYRNRDHWPKHVLVKYEWRSMDEVDAERGLMVLVYGGMFLIFLMMIGVMVTSKEKLAQFYQEVVMEGMQASTSSGKEESKAE